MTRDLFLSDFKDLQLTTRMLDAVWRMIAWNGLGAQDFDITFSHFDIKRFPSYSFCVMMSETESIMRIPLLSKLIPASGPQQQRCCHVRGDGQACKATPQRGREYCFFHDPALREKRKAASRTGGAHSRRRKGKRAFNPLETPAQVGGFLRELMNDVYNGEVGVRRANALARLTPLILGTMEQETKRMETERHDAWVAGEAERQAAYREMTEERRRWESCMQARVAAKLQAQVPGRGNFTPRQETTEQQASTVGDVSASTLAELEPQAGRAEAFSAPAPREMRASTGEDSSTPSRTTSAVLQANTAGEASTPTLAELELHASKAGDGCATRATKPAAARSTVAAGDMARKKHNAQDLERKKEIAYALAPTTMKYSMFNEEGLVVERPHASQESRGSASATQPSQKTREPGPQLDYDNQPSRIPGLLNRHLNYQKYMGAPVSYLKRLGFVFPRQRWRLW
jgi:hypothetical protein